MIFYQEKHIKILCMKSEFANGDDIKAYIDKRNLVKVEFDDSLLQYRIAILSFDDGTSIALILEECRKFKLMKWTWYEGCMIVNTVNGSKTNYELKLFDIALRNFLIEGIDAEEKRLKNSIAEVFTNTVRETDNKKYAYKTIINGVEFVKFKNLF